MREGGDSYTDFIAKGGARPGQRGANAPRPGQRGANAPRPGQRGANAPRTGQRGANAQQGSNAQQGTQGVAFHNPCDNAFGVAIGVEKLA
eukprot:jgi/Tetstr1/439235/TSEL_027677.t1